MPNYLNFRPNFFHMVGICFSTPFETKFEKNDEKIKKHQKSGSKKSNHLKKIRKPKKPDSRPSGGSKMV